MTNVLINFTNLHCQLNRDHRFSNINWTIEAGQHWALLGGNGAGKTALAKLLSHSIAIADGAIGYGEKMSGDKIAYVSFELQQQLYALDNRFDNSNEREDAFDPGTLAQDAILQGFPVSELFTQWVAKLRLNHVLDRGIRFLSSGEIRKVLIVRAILQQPRIIILDNPMEGLDRPSQQDMAELINLLMTDELSIILLSRRREDLLDNITHLLLLQDLVISASGEKAAISNSDTYINLFPPLPPMPENLPLPDRSLEVFKAPKEHPLIAAHKLQVSYHDNCVMRDVDFVVNHGQHTSISGPNGCGKSTLLSLINGDNHKAYGQDITLFGVKRGSGESIWDIKQKFGLVSNDLHNRYISGWSALEVVISGFYDSIGLYAKYGAVEEKTAKAWMKALDIFNLQKTLYKKLSYGQQRMILLARAMVKYPPILILDEPCTGLDEYHRKLFLRTLDFIAAHSDTQLIFISHLPGEIPSCINQELVFKPRAEGLYQLTSP
jgi:molybdate transport system ATP-binding protein